MALGVITVLNAASKSDAPTFCFSLSIAGLGVYATSGIPIKSAIEAKLGHALDIVAVFGRSPTHLSGEYDIDDDLLKTYVGSTGAETANAVDLTGTWNLVVIGK